MTRCEIRPVLLAAILSLVVLLPSIGRAGELRAWDQAEVAALADELYEAVKDLRNSVRKSSNPSIASGQARSTHRLLDTLRLIRNESKHLANRLDEGAGRDETLPVFRRIGRLRLEAAEDARRINLLQPVQDRIEAARTVLEKLEPYYAVSGEEA
jgi:glutamine synthetase type III